MAGMITLAAMLCLRFGQRGPFLSPPHGEGEAGAAGADVGLRFPVGLIRTRAPWNGRPIGADWALVARWGEVIAEPPRMDR